MESISERHLASTYEDGEAIVKQYRRARSLQADNPELAVTEIARVVSRPPSTVRAWLDGVTTPQPIQTIETATEHGWLSPEHGSEQLRALVALVAWINAGGSLSGQSFQPRFVADDPLAIAALDQLCANTGVDYRVEDRTPSRAIEVVPTTDTAVFGRVLSVLGAPVGEKAHSETTLPAVLDEAGAACRRVFVQVYLFNRVVTSNQPSEYRMSEPRGPTYRQALQTLCEEVAGEPVTQETQSRLRFSTAAVETLCGGTPYRSALATRIVYDTMSPPSERALLSTYQPVSRPPGSRYTRAYRAAMSRENPDPAGLANEFGITQGAIHGWLHGSVPKALKAVQTARDRDWFDPSADSRTNSLAELTALTAWIAAFGTLRQSYYPVFRAKTSVQREWFDELADRLNIPYSVRLEDSDRTTELHPSTDATLLGRILGALGARQADTPARRVLPSFLWASKRGALAYVMTWILLRGELNENKLELRRAHGGDSWAMRVLAELCETQLGWDVCDQTERSVVIPYVSVRPDMTTTLPAGLTTAFEQHQLE